MVTSVADVKADLPAKRRHDRGSRRVAVAASAALVPAIAVALTVILPVSVVELAMRTVTPAPAAASTGGHPAAGVRVVDASMPTRARRQRPPAHHPHDNHLDWAALARCESNGHWHDNTGNGYYGGLQFDIRTWLAVGGVGLPSDATRAEQLHRARLLYADRGREPWPVCGVLL